MANDNHGRVIDQRWKQNTVAKDSNVTLLNVRKNGNRTYPYPYCRRQHSRKFRNHRELANCAENTINVQDHNYQLNCSYPDSMHRNHLSTISDSSKADEQLMNSNKCTNNIGSNMLIYRQTSPLAQYAGKVTAIRRTCKVREDCNRMPTSNHDKYAAIPPEKPSQVFWEKRLQGIKSADANSLFNLSQAMKKYGPNYDDLAIIQGMTALLYHNKAPVIGQINHLQLLQADPHVWRDSNQPLCPKIVISEGDIKGQEDRVARTRKKLAEILAQCKEG